ncbi:MAG: class I SAM-dependent methyltransferase, partial [Bacteroidota bacterium]
MEREFAFKEYDLEGMQTLESMAHAPRLNEWMYQTISKNLKGKILEIGSGIGNISEQFLKDKRQLLMSD